jgi:hypothetical protein
MNSKEGIRRLAILAGILGAVVGGIYAYKNLHNVPSDRYQHKVFEELAASDVVTQERSKLLSFKAADSEFNWPQTTEVNGDRVKTIFWNQDHSVDFFVMQDGGLVISEPSPSIWSYLLWIVFPALGFFILWGVIRGIGWAVVGFF